MATAELVEYIDDIMKARYPRLADSQMSTDAGLSINTVHRMRQGIVPRPDKLLALAERWGRTPEEKAQDYYELMKRAGYAPPEIPPQQEGTRTAAESFYITEFELEASAVYLGLSSVAHEKLMQIVHRVPPGGVMDLIWPGTEPTPESYAFVTDETAVAWWPTGIATDEQKWILNRIRQMPIRRKAQIWENMKSVDDPLAVTEQRIMDYNLHRVDRDALPVIESIKADEIEQFIDTFMRLPEPQQRHLLYQASQLWLAHLAEKLGIQAGDEVSDADDESAPNPAATPP
jgi:hypothetical protein